MAYECAIARQVGGELDQICKDFYGNIFEEAGWIEKLGLNESDSVYSVVKQAIQILIAESG